jgi:hypothetical protein
MPREAGRYRHAAEVVCGAEQSDHALFGCNLQPTGRMLAPVLCPTDADCASLTALMVLARSRAMLKVEETDG